MKTHVQIVAALHIVMGALTLMGAVIVFIFIGMAGGIAATQGEGEAAGVLGIIAVVVGSFLTLLALPSIIGGWALLAGCSWGRPFVLVLGALELLNIPFGTALGIYTFWALLNNPQPPPPVTSSLRPIT
jgi:hypothetical protein